MNTLKRRASGFSYLEVMVALAVLAVCAVPAADAIRGGANAALVAADKATELRCMKNRMEAVLAEPYDRLVLAATDDAKPSPSYSLPADENYPAAGTCMARHVFISLYEHKYGSAEKYLTTANSTSADRAGALVRITVAPTDNRDAVATSGASRHTYTFTTLVGQ